MKFKRVDKSTVRCIVSQDEIEERGLKIEDLIHNGDKAQEFLNEVVDMAEEEVGFKMTSGIQAVQAAFLPNHDVVFTFSDNAENIGMDQALDHLKDMLSDDGMFDTDRIEEIRDLNGQNQADAFAQLIKEIRDSKASDGGDLLENSQNDAPKEEGTSKKKSSLKKAETKRQSVNGSTMVIFFENLSNVCTFCRHFMGFEFKEESLYKCDKQFALLLDTQEIGKEEMAAIYMQASEYGLSHTRRESRACAIREHDVCVIKKHALRHLQEL